MSAIQNLFRSVGKIGLGGTIRLLAEKRAKRSRLQILLQSPIGKATLRKQQRLALEIGEKEKATIVERAEEILRDENYFFTFLFHLRGTSDPWNYDPIDKKYWPKRRYEETAVHSADTPRDVKLVWEINRFKYLPLLAQAAYVTGSQKYAAECESRILSWIEGNPFAGTINWSSPLEIAIRGISWATTLRILEQAGFDISKNEIITRSVWQHAAYLDAELSVDKIVRSNHLIGETAGLYVLSTSFDFPEADFFRIRAKKVLVDSLLMQTYPDGASREASGWYHTFVTDFADIALRSSNSHGDDLEKECGDRFELMSIYRNSIFSTDGEVVKYGDCDFGKALQLSHSWKESVYGSQSRESRALNSFFESAQHLTARLGKNYLFARAGEFGWGGSGFSSHAHDDFLSPILALDGIPMLVDPGTFAYNGVPGDRDTYRDARMHNGLIISEADTAVMEPSFGWKKVRPNASIDYFSSGDEEIIAEASFGEWRGQHSRRFILRGNGAVIEDHLELKNESRLEWNFHFHPRWRLERISASKFALRDYRNNQFEFELSAGSGELVLLNYDFSPTNLGKTPAQKIQLHRRHTANNSETFRFEITRTS